MAELLRVLEHTRALNHALSMSRLERMLKIFRTWINVPGVEGGFALTRDELECVLEYPRDTRSVDFLFETFKTQRVQRVDLLTLLTAATLLCQGSLEEKAKFVFSLVDLDTEDDIVEEELALVISTCSNGLQWLGVHAESLLELDALAIAYEAFEFADVEDGGKMSFAAFLKWCVFHERPQALFERISHLFSMSNVIAMLQQALAQQQADVSPFAPFHQYNAAHFGNHDHEAENVSVVVGPIVGKVTSSSVTLLLEVDRAATGAFLYISFFITIVSNGVADVASVCARCPLMFFSVQCFAFEAGVTNKAPQLGAVVRVVDLSVYEPQAIEIADLQPGTAYAVRLLGVKRADRKQCVAHVTTLHRTVPNAFGNGKCDQFRLKWTIRAFNHHRDSSRALTDFEQEMYSNAAHVGYESSPSPMLTLHSSCLRVPVEKLSGMTKLLKANREGAAEMVSPILKQCYRDSLSRWDLAPLLRYQANLLLDRNDEVLFGASVQQMVSADVRTRLVELAYPIWKSYIGSLWDVSDSDVNDDQPCIVLEGMLLAPLAIDRSLEPLQSEDRLISDLKKTLEKNADVECIVLATGTPIIAPTAQNSYQEDVQTDQYWSLVDELTAWKRSALNRSIILLSFSHKFGCQSLLSVKDTTISITQCICGPLSGSGSDRESSSLVPEQTHEKVVVRHGKIESGPHFVAIAVDINTSDHKVKTIATMEALHTSQCHIKVLVGPVVGWVSPRSARILLECDEEGQVTCVFTDRITGEKTVRQQQTKRYLPVIFSIQHLRPGRIYDVSFRGLHCDKDKSNGNSISAVVQTPYDPAPSWTLVVVADDAFLGGRVKSGAMESSKRENDEATGCLFFVSNIASHLLPQTRGMYADLTLHIGNTVCLAHELTSVYNLYQQRSGANGDDDRNTTAHYEELIRGCVRRHWGAVPENRELLSRGAHVFTTLGLLRSLLTMESDTGVPLSFLLQVRRVVREYEAVGIAGIEAPSQPAERFLTRLQHDGVLLLTLDTLENVVTSSSSADPQFAQLQASMLTTCQWDAIELLLATREKPQMDLRLLVILCDVPLIWQDAEFSARAIWQKESKPRGSTRSTTCAGFANAWSLYSQELDKLLQLLFRKKEQDPAFHVTVLCSGQYASRTTIREVQTGLELEQIVVGPISSSSTPAGPTECHPSYAGTILNERYAYTHHFPAADTQQQQQQYCVVDLVAHPQGSTSSARFLVQHHPEARVVLGPIIGRVTPRSARILVELDRPVEKCTCVLTDTARGQRFASELSVDAFAPTVFKMEGLHADSRYAIAFEGVLVGSDGSVFGYLQTPALTPLTLEWVVVQHNMMSNFLHDPDSHPEQQRDPSLAKAKTERLSPVGNWPRLLQRGMRAYSAQASAATYTHSGDTLGDATDVNSTLFNPWFYIEETFLSEPMRNPQLVVHLGGQVDMSRAFSDKELLALVQRLGSGEGGNGLQESDTSTQALNEEVRHRIQEVYRLTWGMPPLRHMLGYASNLMLLNDESDLFFSTERLKHIVASHKNDGSNEELIGVSDTAIANAASALRVVAYEFWQRYQNQLWVDVNERDIVLNAVKNSTKFAFSSTSAICRMVFMNLSQEVHDLRASQPVIVPSGGNKSPKKKHAPHSSTAVKESSLVEANDEPAPLNLFTNATWKTLEDALLSSTTASATGSTSSVLIQQLVVIIPADFVEWSKKHPQLRPDMVRVFEKCFAWKLENRKHRNVAIICSSDRDEDSGAGGSSLSFDVTDEKLGEKLTLSSVGSISDPREIVRSEKPHTSKRTTVTPSSGDGSKKKKTAASQGKSGAPLAKGFFSKRYTYQSTLSLAPTAAAQQPKAKQNHAASNTTPSVVSSPPATEQSSSNSIISNLKLANVASAAASQERHQQQPTTSRTFASFQFLSDYRSGFLNESLHYFPPKASPRATLGPVLGRISINEVAAEDPKDPLLVTATVRILLEINANAHVACVVTDSLANEELRVVRDMSRDVPHVFCIEGLRLERRYVYRFEGIYNSSSRRGCFHTPSASARAINFIALSSNFPEQVDPAQESLWVTVLERVRVPWCGIDAIIHLGGQVPLHEAAVQCFQWLQRELRKPGAEHVNTEKLRRKVRKRFQQHYHLAWNLPHVREILACVSNWFLPSQADIAPFLRNQLKLHTAAAQVVLDVAKQVVADYQLSLMYHQQQDVSPGASVIASPATSELRDLGTSAIASSSSSEAQESVRLATQPGVIEEASIGQLQQPIHKAPSSSSGGDDPHSSVVIALESSGASPKNVNSVKSGDSPVDSSTSSNLTFVQNGEIGFFFCDMRSVPADGCEKITCNNRLAKPLNAQEYPVISESGWLKLESALKKKKVLVFVLCMELPLILTSAEYVNQVRDKLQVANASNNNHTLSLTEQQEQQEEASGNWQLYDHKHLFQHWVACKRQLEQLLGLLFRWKTRRSGRDVLILSGGVKIGLDTLIQETVDPTSSLSLRNLTCGPITASLEPFEFPLSGVACPIFGGGAKDDRFTFAHKPVSSNNFVLAQVAVVLDTFKATGATGLQAEQALSANIEAEFVVHDEQQDYKQLLKAKQRSIEKFRRFPIWWSAYIPMGKAVFWDDVVSLKAASDDEMVALHEFVYHERALSAAIEVFYEKYQFAETARMEELRSRHVVRGSRQQQQQQRFDVEGNLRAVIAELWKVIPEAKRQRIACFLDPFVFDFLLSYVAPGLLEKCRNDTLGEDEEQAIELEYFGNLCRDFIFNACVLHLAVRTQQEDAEAARVAAKRELEERLMREREDKEHEESELALEKTRLEQLMRADPEQYAKILLAKENTIKQEKLARKQEKLERKKAERLHELEEERAIAKEEKKLNKLAETDAGEYARRQLLLETRVRKLQEKKQQRAAEKAHKKQHQQQEEGDTKATW